MIKICFRLYTFNLLYRTFRFNFKGIIDYIFYTRQTMTPLGLLGPLNNDWFKENKILGCPHPHIPSGKILQNSIMYVHFEFYNFNNVFFLPVSDHFPLLVEFELSPNAHQNNSNGLIGRR